MVKSCRKASTQHCSYGMISFSEALRPAFFQSNKIHRSKSFSQTRKFYSSPGSKGASPADCDLFSQCKALQFCTLYL